MAATSVPTTNGGRRQPRRTNGGGVSRLATETKPDQDDGFYVTRRGNGVLIAALDRDRRRRY